jgi:hypothetical protein
LITVPIILDQAVDYCSHYFGSGRWLLFQLFSIKMLVTVGNSNQQLDHKIMGTVTNSLIQNNGNSNQQHDKKSPEQ